MNLENYGTNILVETESIVEIKQYYNKNLLNNEIKLISKENYEETINSLTKSIEDDSSNLDLLANRAKLYALNGDSINGMKDLDVLFGKVNDITCNKTKSFISNLIEETNVLRHIKSMMIFELIPTSNCIKEGGTNYFFAQKAQSFLDVLSRLIYSYISMENQINKSRQDEQDYSTLKNELDSLKKFSGKLMEKKDLEIAYRKIRMNIIDEKVINLKKDMKKMFSKRSKRYSTASVKLEFFFDNCKCEN